MAALVGFVVGHELFDRGTVGPVRHQRARLSGAGQHVDAGSHDLGCASMVDGKSHDLDAGKSGLDVDEQTRVGAVESVHRLRGVTDEEEIVAAGAQQVDECVLERIEVLGLVDEQVTEPPSDGVGELAVAAEVADGVRQDVVEVEDAASLLQRRIVGIDRSAPVDAGSRVPLFAARGGGIPFGIDASGRCPVDLGEVCRQTATVSGVDRVAHQAAAVADDGEGTALGVGPALLEDAEHHRVEGARLDVFAQSEPHQTLAHLAGRLSGEGECERVAGIRRVGGDPVRDSPGQHPRLARSGAGDDRDETGFGGDRGALVGIQIGDQRVRIHRFTVRDGRRATPRPTAFRRVRPRSTRPRLRPARRSHPSDEPTARALRSSLGARVWRSSEHTFPDRVTG